MSPRIVLAIVLTTLGIGPARAACRIRQRHMVEEGLCVQPAGSVAHHPGG
ncbi:MAG: hypothetical protein U1E76_21870 [Planctomycetota bacterium]